MLSHDLAKILLENENYSIAIQAYKHHYNSDIDKHSHGSLKIFINNHRDCEILITPDSDIPYNQMNVVKQIV